MGFVYSRTGGGLVVAEHGSDEAAVARALKRHDPDLRLVPQRSDSYGRTYYSVYRYAGSERPAHLVCVWTDETTGDPLPLSMRLLDRVQLLDKNTAGSYLNEDERDALERQRRQKQAETDEQDLAADWATREGRSAVLHRGQHLRQARTRTGYHERST